jgi:hypothetical protein
MSDENQGDKTSDQTQDPTGNIKAEFQRKFENTNAELNQIKQMLVGLTAKPAPKEEPEEDLDVFEPEKVKKYVEKKVSSAINSVKSEQAEANRRAQERQGVIYSLGQEYPEILQPTSEMAQEALRIINSLPAHEQESATAVKAAILEAAMNKGITPKSKRQKGSDDKDTFQLGGGKKPSGGKPAEDDIDPDTLAWSQLLGRDITKKEVKESLKKHSKRNWRQYE